ncbi:MAG TPA: cobalt ECF transporter T component CbiQ [Desulfomonilaceae bacterium]|nr:cobalt ECF transporter T component CbiQ [Desulfomonilaceae bacterium]
MFDLFSDIFARKDNVFTRMDARAKMIVAGCLILAIISSTRIWMPSIVFVACVSAMLAVGIPVKLVLLRLAAPMGIVFVLMILQVFLTPGTPLAGFSLFGRTVAATHEGFMHGSVLGSRVLGAVSVMLLLGSVTPAYKIFHGLRWFRVPEGWVELALLVYRYTFTLLDQTADIAAAQRVRLGYSGMRRSLGSLGVLAGTVVARSMDQAMKTYEAMSLRGYQGNIPFGPMPKMNASDRRNVVLAVPLIFTSYFILEWWAK